MSENEKQEMQENVQETTIPESAPVSSPKPAPQKNHTVLKTLLAAVICFGAGYGGAAAAISRNTNTSAAATSETTQSASSTADSGSTQTVSTSEEEELTIREIAEIAAPSVVVINTTVTSTTSGIFGTESSTTSLAGSGVIISSDGYIITNNHVIEDASEIQVSTYDGTDYTAELIGTDSKTDIAVIKIDATDLTAATIGDSSAIAVGDTAVVIGNPLGTLGGTVTAGIISATDRTVTINNEEMDLIQTDASINSGNSGGGLFNGKGELIGIVNAKDSGVTSSGTIIEGLGFAIPINTAYDVAQQLIENGYVTDRATIGVTLQTLTQDYNGYQAGVYIAGITEGGAAEAAGLQVGDRIIAIDGNEVSSYTEISSYLKTKAVGDQITITVVRDGEQLDYTLTLTAPIVTSNSN